MIRFFDLTFSLVLLILLSPLLILVILWNMFTGEHEIFFMQTRIGKNGKKFKIIKFATMLKNSSQLGIGGFTELNDSRFLPLGSFMRKTKINELPQLLNILRGEMSLVGFRPLAKASFDKVSEIGDKTTYSEMPGITSPASIFLRNEEEMLMNVEDKQKYYDEHILPLKFSLDKWWAENRSLFNYFAILFLTALSLFFPLRVLPINILKDLPRTNFF
mgnify:CR=1 FL=1|tara:strand:- start:557 stop:1207 length:651 start_codon:yes stop_codon:yes gene_type:complete